MKYFRYYETAEDFKDEYYGEKYSEPWLSYTLPQEQVNYNKTEEEQMFHTMFSFEVISGGSIQWKRNTQFIDNDASISYKKNDEPWVTAWTSLEGTWPLTIDLQGLGTFEQDYVDTYFGYMKFSSTGVGYEGLYIEVYSDWNFGIGDSVYVNDDSGEGREGDYIVTGLTTNTFVPTTINVVPGDIVQFKSNETYGFLDNNERGSILVTNNGCLVKAYGNFMSLVYGDDFEENSEFPDDVLQYGGNSVYKYFFRDIGVIDASNVIFPAKKIPGYYYGYIFSDCETLVYSPKKLYGIELSAMCYGSMFYGCTNLITAPELPATTLADNCYDGMFSNCTSLVSAPKLPATTLASYCYDWMFKGCASLTNTPTLPAKKLVRACYYGMFDGCTSLRNISPMLFTEAVDAWGACAHMFANCTSLTAVPELLPTDFSGSHDTATFDTGIYDSMFAGCTSLLAGPSVLPATVLDRSCYHGMFSGCTNLVNAPRLPLSSITSGADRCYSQMFEGCSSLVTAPSLPATTLEESCYSQMFEGCSSLVTAPSLPATTLKNSCYHSMFKDCTSLVNAPELPASAETSTNALPVYCYQKMFAGCTSLVNAPVLPAKYISYSQYYDASSYHGLFSGCSNLNYVKCMILTTPNNQTTFNWLAGVSPTGTFVKNSAATWTTTGPNGIPTGWTVETETP